MDKKATIILVSSLVIGVALIFGFSGSSESTPTAADNVKVTDGIQYVRVTAKGGYSPKVSTAKAGIPTKLIVATNGTYDCSAFININEIGYRKALPQTGETTIDIGTKKPGEILQAVCGMGMYNFSIKFE